MSKSNSQLLSHAEYQALAEMRYQIRRFLHFSENVARAASLEPQQHQALLAVRAASPDGPTVGEMAQRLFIRHHSAVGLIDRLERMKLVTRLADKHDGRKVVVRLTSEGEEALRHLSLAHREELEQIGPDVIRALRAVLPPDAAQRRSE